jgi:hypothetical protein
MYFITVWVIRKKDLSHYNLIGIVHIILFLYISFIYFTSKICLMYFFLKYDIYLFKKVPLGQRYKIKIWNRNIQLHGWITLLIKNDSVT